MKTIQQYSTKTLVDELKFREGVEFISVDIMDRCGIIVDNENGVCIYSARREGPEIILRITD